MQKRRLYLSLVSITGLWLLAAAASGQTWTATSAPVNSWNAVAISADGTRMAAVADAFNAYGDGLIYTSSDSGATWLPSTAPSTNWYAVALSANGMKLVAAGDAGIYTSPDFGATWVMRTNIVLRNLASSADGTIVAGGITVGGTGPGWISLDSGATWTRSVNPGNNFACSAEGTRLVAVGLFDSIIVSTNAGLSWRLAFVPPGGEVGNCQASSADGLKLTAGVVACPCAGGGPGPIFASSDGGLSWVAASSPDANWYCIASSADGTRGIAAAVDGIYTSSDSANTWHWSAAPGFVRSVASSADGAKLLAAVYGGGIYLGQSTPSPTLNISPAGTNLLLSWTVPSMSFTLQQNLDLTRDQWTDVAATPTFNFTRLQYEVLVEPTLGGNFYRLKH